MSRLRSVVSSFSLSFVPFALSVSLLLPGCRDTASDAGAPRSDSMSKTEAGAPSNSDGLSWPILPRTREDVQRLVSSSLLRRPGEPTRGEPIDGTIPVLQASLEELARAPSGDTTLRDVLAERMKQQKNTAGAYLLVGVSHASADSVVLFKKLVEAPASYTYVGVELLAADGHWSGMADDAQRGSTAALEAYLERGDATSLTALKAAHEQSDYVAWKLGYADTVMDLAVAARAGSYALLPLDLPPAMKTRLAPTLGDALLDLREVHAALALRSALKRHAAAGRGPLRVAMLWGDAHVGEAGIARFLPASADVTTVHVVGSNGSPFNGKTLVLNDPILLPGKAGELVSVLPDVGTKGTVDRVRETASPIVPVRPGEVVVNVSGESGTRLTHAALGPRRADLDGKKAVFRVSPGPLTYVLETKTERVVGALSLTTGETCDVSFDAKTRTTRIEHHLPK